MATALQLLVERVMEQNDWTLERVALRGGLSISTVSAIKNGTRGVRSSDKTLKKLARGLELQEKVVLEAAGRRAPADPESAEEGMILSAIRGIRAEDRPKAVAAVMGVLRAFEKGAG